MSTGSGGGSGGGSSGSGGGISATPAGGGTDGGTGPGTGPGANPSASPAGGSIDEANPQPIGYVIKVGDCYFVMTASGQRRSTCFRNRSQAERAMGAPGNGGAVDLNTTRTSTTSPRGGINQSQGGGNGVASGTTGSGTVSPGASAVSGISSSS